VQIRAGYTLIELLLVLAIFVIAAAAVAPSLRGLARTTALKSSANDVRTALTRGHVLAMKTGRVYVFQYELGSGKYKLEPWVGGDDALESPDANLTGSATNSAKDDIRHEKSLPEGTKFVQGDAAIASRSQRVEQELTSSGSTGVTWSRPILFFSDGSASDAYLIIGNDHHAGIRVDLRGMTSAVKVGDLSDLHKLEQEDQISR
jgi:prepilin-type N-terminal cleavage/methylation domain-containing protein